MERFKNINYVYVLAILLMIRGIVEFSFPQALLALVVFGYLGYTKWLKHTEDSLISEKLEKLEAAAQENQLIKQELVELRTNLSGIMIKNASRPQAMKQELDGRRFF